MSDNEVYTYEFVQQHLSPKRIKTLLSQSRASISGKPDTTSRIALQNHIKLLKNMIATLKSEVDTLKTVYTSLEPDEFSEIEFDFTCSENDCFTMKTVEEIGDKFISFGIVKIQSDSGSESESSSESSSESDSSSETKSSGNPVPGSKSESDFDSSGSSNSDDSDDSN